MGEMAHLTADIHWEEGEDIEHEARVVRQVRTAAVHIGRIPGPREAFHLVCNGRYALWDMVPAVLSLAGGAVIEDLYLATLGFSKFNVVEIVEMLDAGTIKRLSLLCSHYFKGTSGGIYELAANELYKRSNARFLSIRTHAKLVCLKLTDGRTLTIEASANLRSCKNIEQMTIFGHPNLYEFHTGWINDLFMENQHDQTQS